MCLRPYVPWNTRRGKFKKFTSKYYLPFTTRKQKSIYRVLVKSLLVNSKSLLVSSKFTSKLRKFTSKWEKFTSKLQKFTSKLF